MPEKRQKKRQERKAEKEKLKEAALEKKKEAVLQKRKRQSHLLSKDLRPILYGFGDDAAPLPESLKLVEELVGEYICDLVYKAMQLAEQKQRGNIFQGLHKEVLEHLRSKDKKKYYRALELLRKHDEIKEARKIMDINDFAGAT
mmetsp:Transcript_8168/g.30133  ORF Transcript_8168/g.30133 Transcript_8168/m.30133 type:complete len:144 (-) Transcript_8168:371-802(-)